MGEGNMVVTRIVTNGHGVRIKTCCASCEWATISEVLLRKDAGKQRYCIKHNLTTKNSECCDCWEMKRFWKTFVAKGDGKVKSLEYLHCWMSAVNEYVAKIDKAKENGDKLTEERLRDELEEMKRKRERTWER